VRREACATPLFPELSQVEHGAREEDTLVRRGAATRFDPGRWEQMARTAGLDPKQPAIVALSGGADSVYLLHAIAASEPRPRVVAVHVDHGLRGAAGAEDARFCRDLCRELGVPFVLRELALDARAASLEARAREKRYRILCEEAARLRIPTVLTGHHADDALETLLQRWLRGTDLHGLAGLRTRLRLPRASAPRSWSDPEPDDPAREILNPTERDVLVVRPLIAMRREEVRQCLREKELGWREDASNSSPRFTRNRVRHLLLPEIERACGASAIENLRGFGRAVESLEERCAELTAGIAWDPPAFAPACRGQDDARLGGTLARERIVSLPPTLQRRALWRLLVEGTGHPPGRMHLDALLSDLATGRSGRYSLPGRWSLHLRSDRLHLVPPALPRAETRSVPASAQLSFEFASAASIDVGAARLERDGWRLEVPGTVVLDDGRCIVAELVDLPPRSAIPRSPSCVELEARDLAGPLLVDWPRCGDRFHPLGAPGGKSLSRFFSGIGLPLRDRSRVPLVREGRDIVWVAGIRPGHARRVRSTTSRRLRLRLLASPDLDAAASAG
jgi:tRNA(Ile)-lysidine synthase